MTMNYLYIGLLQNSGFGLVEVLREGANYRRVEMGPGDWKVNNLAMFPEDSYINNVDVVKFPIALKGWGTITHFGVFDSLHGGNILASGTLSMNIIVDRPIQIQFEKHKLVVDLIHLGFEI